jgi:hypothetical protein
MITLSRTVAPSAGMCVPEPRRVNRVQAQGAQLRDVQVPLGAPRSHGVLPAAPGPQSAERQIGRVLP